MLHIMCIHTVCMGILVPIYTPFHNQQKSLFITKGGHLKTLQRSHLHKI